MTPDLESPSTCLGTIGIENSHPDVPRGLTTENHMSCFPRGYGLQGCLIRQRRTIMEPSPSVVFFDLNPGKHDRWAMADDLELAGLLILVEIWHISRAIITSHEACPSPVFVRCVLAEPGVQRLVAGRAVVAPYADATDHPWPTVAGGSRCLHRVFRFNITNIYRSFFAPHWFRMGYPWIRRRNRHQFGFGFAPNHRPGCPPHASRQHARPRHRQPDIATLHGQPPLTPEPSAR
jgi:hypothetical protein